MNAADAPAQLEMTQEISDAIGQQATHDDVIAGFASAFVSAVERCGFHR